MRITNDDAIWRYQPRLVDLRGWTVVGQPRYVVLAISAAAAALSAPPLLLTFGGWPGGLYVGAVAFVAGYLLAPHLTAERPLLAWIAYSRGELRGAAHWVRCRRQSGRARPRSARFPLLHRGRRR
ncbi:MAG: hypothetical protein ACFCVF_07910 [Kineosporiaceae bacterium]